MNMHYQIIQKFMFMAILLVPSISVFADEIDVVEPHILTFAEYEPLALNGAALQGDAQYMQVDTALDMNLNDYYYIPQTLRESFGRYLQKRFYPSENAQKIISVTLKKLVIDATGSDSEWRVMRWVDAGQMESLDLLIEVQVERRELPSYGSKNASDNVPNYVPGHVNEKGHVLASTVVTAQQNRSFPKSSSILERRKIYRQMLEDLYGQMDPVFIEAVRSVSQ